MKRSAGYRFTKQELILRLFAFHDQYQDYYGRLARFLNDYMKDNKDFDRDSIEEKRELFERTVDVVYRKVYRGRIPAKLSITVLESLLVGISFNLTYLEGQPDAHVHSLYNSLLGHEEFSEQRLSEGLSGRQRVISRLSAARKTFSGK